MIPVEVPGVTDQVLAAMSDDAVMRLRWAVFSRALTPMVRKDFGHELQALADLDSPPKSTELRSRRAVQREELEQGRLEQARLRKVLALDDEDDDA